MNEQFQQLLTAARLTKAELAKAVGVRPQTVSYWFRKRPSSVAIAFLKERAETIRLREILERITKGEKQ